MIPRSDLRRDGSPRSFLRGQARRTHDGVSSYRKLLVEGNVIDAALGPGVAARDPGRREHGALDGAVLLDRADRVGRARRVVLADVAIGMGDRRTITMEQARHGIAGKQRERLQSSGCLEPAVADGASRQVALMPLSAPDSGRLRRADRRNRRRGGRKGADDDVACRADGRPALGADRLEPSANGVAHDSGTDLLAHDETEAGAPSRPTDRRR